jgi:hypothetical protein
VLCQLSYDPHNVLAINQDPSEGRFSAQNFLNSATFDRLSGSQVREADLLAEIEDLAGMARLELANQLIENQPAFHFAFIPKSKDEV